MESLKRQYWYYEYDYGLGITTEAWLKFNVSKFKKGHQYYIISY